MELNCQNNCIKVEVCETSTFFSFAKLFHLLVYARLILPPPLIKPQHYAYSQGLTNTNVGMIYVHCIYQLLYTASHM